MRVSVLQQNLKAALDNTTRAIDSRPTLPVLANVRLVAEDHTLSVTGTNLEMTITTRIGAKVEQPGAITLPAKTLHDLVKTMPNERIDLVLDPDTETVNLRGGRANSNINGINADEFPAVPDFDRADLTLDTDTFAEIVSQTAPFAARDDSRPILTGVKVEVEGNRMTCVTADGYRLAVRHAEIEQAFDTPRDVIIPAGNLQDVVAVAGHAGDVDQAQVQLPSGDREFVLFRVGQTTVTTQTLAGRFPRYGEIIPSGGTTEVSLYAGDLVRGAKLAEIFSRDNANSAVFTVTPDGLRITGKSAERGDSEECVTADVTGDLCEIAMNVRYVVEVANVLNGAFDGHVPDDGQGITLTLNGDGNPAMITVGGSELYTHVIMPMSR